jgi:hypothetical protein
MSINDLKTRLRDIPGTQNLTMVLEAGRIVLRWAESMVASADASSSDAELEAAVRNAAKLPPVAMIPDKPIPAAAPIAHEGKPMADITGGASLGASIRDMIEDHKRQMADLIEGHKATMVQGFEKQIRAARAVGSLAAAVDRAGDDLLALVGQYTNEL